jgi:hypothetical protein
VLYGRNKRKLLSVNLQNIIQLQLGSSRLLKLRGADDVDGWCAVLAVCVCLLWIESNSWNGIVFVHCLCK